MALIAARLLGREDDRQSTRLYLTVAGTNLALNLLLMPTLGAIGAAWAFMLSCALGALLALTPFLRRFGTTNARADMD
jgi:Na+-driven multidrug efflux pump